MTSIPDVKGMMHDIAVSSKIGTCLFVASASYLLADKAGWTNWDKLPEWSDPIAWILFWYSAASILWEAVPKICRTIRNWHRKRQSLKEAQRLSKYEKFVLLALSQEPAKAKPVSYLKAESMKTTDLVILDAAHSLVRKGLVREGHNVYGMNIKLTHSGIERVAPIQESFVGGNQALWDDK